MLPPQDLSSLRFKGATGELKSISPLIMFSLLLSKDIIQLHISCPSDKEEEKSTKDVPEKEDKDKNKEKAPRKMLSRGEDVPSFLVRSRPSSSAPFPSIFKSGIRWPNGPSSSLCPMDYMVT